VKPVVRTSVEPTRRRAWEMVSVVAGGVGPVSLSVRPGEMLGLTGLRGAGQETIGRAIFGLVPVTEGGCLLEGKEVVVPTPSDAIALGLRFASGDRRAESVVQGFSVAENLFLNPCIKGKPVLYPIDLGRERQDARDLGGFLQLSPNDPSLAVENLSGGNQQKVVIGRWLDLQGKLLVLEDPTAGVDVGAKGEIYRLLFQALQTGLSIIVVSTDFVEVAAICHRALVFSRGAIVAEIHEGDLTAEALLGAAAVTDADECSVVSFQEAVDGPLAPV
jgi:ribose transport system ATP-binding protein